MSPSQIAPWVDTFMIAVLPQPGQRHRNANEVAAWAQSQFVSGCFIVGTLYQFGQCQRYRIQIFGTVQSLIGLGWATPE
jgi:hypothetical protein